MSPDEKETDFLWQAGGATPAVVGGSDGPGTCHPAALVVLYRCPTMAEELSAARDAIQRASGTVDDATIREQLDSIDEGLMEMTVDAEGTPAKTEGDVPHGENLKEVEEKVVGLASRTEEPTRSYLEDARDSIDAYRRKFTREW